ncbi:ATP-binding cassette domain-containing protein [Kamptonema cortianum]|nr:ATP-binding cassette domain-containing protein [Geitlerinema splendidum]MDK3160936.1 ATP-binding cassette domain-containing protein [Kamptonema cortianum]
MAIIEVEGLTKTFRIVERLPGGIGALKSVMRPTYKDVHAVNDVSFQINEGEFVGFLGPNGAGKTTTIKILTGILAATSGRVNVAGYAPFDRKPEMLRQLALVMGNRQQLWWDLPAVDSFAVLKEIYGVPDNEYQSRLDELVEPLGLNGKLRTQVRKLSLGERMKCELVAALLHRPRIVVLDEPTIGLDISSQRNIRAFLKHYNQTTGATIILTSHYMQDIEALCERVIVINHGSLVFDGKLKDLTSKFSETRRLRVHLETPVPESDFEPYGQLISAESGNYVLDVVSGRVATVTSEILSRHSVLDLSIEETEIEDVIERVFTQPQ